MCSSAVPVLIVIPESSLNSTGEEVSVDVLLMMVPGDLAELESTEEAESVHSILTSLPFYQVSIPLSAAILLAFTHSLRYT